MTAKRDRAMLELMIRTGLRRAEVVGADRADLSEYRGHVVLTVTSKGGERETIKVPTPVARALAEYLAARTDDSPALLVSHARKKGAQVRLQGDWTQDRIEENREINRIRGRVADWRKAGYPHTTSTTRELLKY